LRIRPDQPDHLDANLEKTKSSGGQVGGADPTTDPTTGTDKPDHAHNPTTDPTTITPCQLEGSSDVVGLVGFEMDDNGEPGMNPFIGEGDEFAF
jgi:hypothetical protein